MTASIAASTTTPKVLIYKGEKAKPQHKHIDTDPKKKKMENKQCEKDREDENLSSCTKA
jgi:hypothetical protein